MPPWRLRGRHSRSLELALREVQALFTMRNGHARPSRTRTHIGGGRWRRNLGSAAAALRRMRRYAAALVPSLAPDGTARRDAIAIRARSPGSAWPRWRAPRCPMQNCARTCSNRHVHRAEGAPAPCSPPDQRRHVVTAAFPWQRLRRWTGQEGFAVHHWGLLPSAPSTADRGVKGYLADVRAFRVACDDDLAGTGAGFGVSRDTRSACAR